MAVKIWQPIKVRFCEHVQANVALEAEELIPAEFMPDTYPRVEAHRCSQGYLCSLSSKVACTWSGTNPGYDPFQDKS
ncbi:MAG: hypothetical protein ABFD44_07020 [Anaerolineaceae bacterium]